MSDIPVPEIASFQVRGQTYHVRGLSGKGLRLFRQLSKDGEPVTEVQMAAMGLCDESGALKYDVNNPAHLEELDEKAAAVIQKAALKFMEISGLTENAVEEAEKN
jgi:predicted nuclease with RNAse H fold